MKKYRYPTKRDSEMIAYQRGVIHGIIGRVVPVSDLWYKINGRLHRHYKNGLLADKKQSEDTRTEGKDNAGTTG